MKKRYVSILTAVLILLICVNIAFTALAMRATDAAARAYEERHAIISAIYESSVAGGVFTRLARYYAITGNDLAYESFFAELELDRYGETIETFAVFGVTEEELSIFNDVTDLRMQMLDIHREVIRLRRAGYIEEAIALAHGPEIQAVGIPAGPMSDEARDLVYERTTETALGQRRIAEIFGNLSIVSAILLTMGSILLLVFVGKSAMPGFVEVFGAAMLVLSCTALLFSILARTASEEQFYAYQKQYALINASYNAERGGEILTRMSRMFVITGNEFQHDSYFEELDRDRFGNALGDFILLNAESDEINTLVDVLGRLNLLRQIEAEAILLRTTGYYQQALDTAFGAEVAALDGPISLLGEQLRNMVNERTQGAIDAANYRHDMFVLVSLISLILLVAAGISKLVAIKHVHKEAMPGIIAHMFKRIESAAIRTKMFASFAIVILIFTTQVGIDAYFDIQIDRLNFHNSYYLTERSEILFTFHQEFIELRRLLRETFLSSSWLGAANEAEWILAEQNLSYSHAWLSHLKESYEASVIADPIIVATNGDSRIFIMGEIISHIDAIYEVYRENFFLSGNMSLDAGNVMDYTDAAEIFLQFLRYFINVNRDAAEERIIEFQNYSTTITLVSLAAAFVTAFLMAFSMLRSFSSRIKVIEAASVKVAQGDFELELQDGTDEITTAFTKTLDVFSHLVSEIYNVTDEGKKGNMDARIDPADYQGKHRETVLAINALLDSSEEMLRQKELSQVAQKASEEKSKFLARMSHEIRTPITAVLGISEICLRSSALSQYMKEALSKIHDSAQTLLNIVNDILDFSKIEAGKMPIVDKEYEVAKLIGNTTQMHMVYMEHKTVSLRVHVDEQLPARLIGDTLRIRQITSNLISNAFKYTESGFVSLSFSRGEERDGYVELIIVIADTGFGMSENQLEVMKTNEYSRFYESEDNFISGTGLGVPIVYSLAKMMNGQVNFESEVGKGTTARIVVPQKICTTETLGEEVAAILQNFESNSWQTEEKFKLALEPMPYGKVLVVDDVDANLFVAKGLLAFYGISVDTCSSGQEAVNKIEQGNVYDVVFMDILMPEQNGTETMRIMRDKGYSHPIVALTANALVGQAEEYTKRGFDDVVSKPIQSTQLNDVLLKFIRDKQPPEVIAEAKAKSSIHELADSSFADENQFANKNDINSFLNDESVIEKLRDDFARGHKDALVTITQALNGGDTETAHRLAHIMKSSAALIGEKTLSQIAKDAEDSLRDKKTLSDTQLSDLENELNHVLDNITLPKLTEVKGDMTKEEINELLDKLEPLLQSQNADSLKYIDELRRIPEAAELVKQMDDYDFELADKSMEALRQIYRG
ncbi:MAG: response regulator [Oscillospiraceae bacterium]|nr:response regulator [Oscillospiraceae bacterium]MCL2279286.1 response regulator [Oscillospiraceae bacterium]